MTDLRIRVERDRLVMHGTSADSPGCVLRGVVEMSVKEPIKIKSMTLRFRGKMQVQWIDRSTVGTPPHYRTQRKQRTLFEHAWTFLPPKEKPYTLQPKLHQYPFELVLNGDLPESIDAPSCGSINYKLKAVCERPTFIPNTVSQQTIHILREADLYQSVNPVRIMNEWSDRLAYDIWTSQSAYAPGDTITIHFCIRPKAPGLRIRYISGFLKEYVSFVMGTQVHHTESKVIRFFRDEKFPSGGNAWIKDENIVVPRSSLQVRCDTHNQHFQVNHKLRIVLSLINGEGRLSELRLSLPVTIQHLDDTALPPYESIAQPTMCSSMEMPFQTMFPLSPPLSDCVDVDVASPQSYTEDLLHFDNDPSPDYFNYEPIPSSLRRLPSYRTATSGYRSCS